MPKSPKPKSDMHAPKGRKQGQAGALTTADLIVLSLLQERPMHGYDLLREYERQEVADWASVSKAQVYYALKKLVGLDLIEPAVRTDEVDARDKLAYQPTSTGLTALESELSHRNWAVTRIAQPFATWLGLSIHLPRDEVRRQLEARATFLVGELERERASLDYIKTLTSPRARAGENIVALVIAQLEAEQVWLEALLVNE